MFHLRENLPAMVSVAAHKQNGYGSQGHGHISQDEQLEGGDLRDVRGQGVGNGLQVVNDEAALLNGAVNNAGYGTVKEQE